MTRCFSPLFFFLLAVPVLAGEPPVPERDDVLSVPVIGEDVPPFPEDLVAGDGDVLPEDRVGDGEDHVTDHLPAEEPPPQDPLLQAARAFLAGDRTKTLERGGEHIYPFGGDTQPTLQCAPLRACSLQLDAREHPTAVILGDPGRWIVETPKLDAHAAGLIVVKPRQCNTTTNLMVATTHKRLYDVLLDSPPCGDADQHSLNPDLPYTSRLSFYYPDQILTQLEPPAPPVHEPVCPQSPATVPAFDPKDLECNFRWRATRGFPGRPDAICTHRGRTLIFWPAHHFAGETPALIGLTLKDQPRQVNYTVDEDLYIVGSVLDRGRLLLETQKRRQIALTFWKKTDG